MQGQSGTSPSLLLRIRDRSDHLAWSTFQEVYLPLINSYCVYWGLQPADAEDVAQEVLAVVFRTMPSFDYEPGRGRFRAWLGTVTANEIKSWCARNKRRGETVGLPSDDFNQLAQPASNWSQFFAEHVFRVACNRVREHCEPRTWQCFEATWLEHKPAPDVAREVGLPIHSVYVNKSRVLQRLEEEVRMLADELTLDGQPAGDGLDSPS